MASTRAANNNRYLRKTELSRRSYTDAYALSRGADIEKREHKARSDEIEANIFPSFLSET